MPIPMTSVATEVTLTVPTLVAAADGETLATGGSRAHPPIASAVTPSSASAAWAAASRASGTRYGEQLT